MFEEDHFFSKSLVTPSLGSLGGSTVQICLDLGKAKRIVGSQSAERSKLIGMLSTEPALVPPPRKT
jgi:hypothetical protein